jgi:hypothetical protein
MKYELEVRDVLSDGEDWHSRDIYEAVARLWPTAPYATAYMNFPLMSFDDNPRWWLICRRDAGRWYSNIRGVLLKGQRKGWVRKTGHGWWKKPATAGEVENKCGKG